MRRFLIEAVFLGAVSGFVAIAATPLPAPAAIVHVRPSTMEVQRAGSVDVSRSRQFTVFLRKGVGTAGAERVATYLEEHGMHATPSKDARFVFVRGTFAQAAAAANSRYERVQVVEKFASPAKAPVVKFAPFARLAAPARFPAAIDRLIQATTFSPGPKTPALYNQLPGPIQGYGPADFANIYDIYPAYAANLNGFGTVAALPECGIINQASMQYYEQTFGLPSNNVQLISVDGTEPTDEQLGVEPALDAERIIGTAPKAKVKMYFIDGDTCDLGSFADALARIAEDNDATDVSVSYGLSEATWGFIGAEDDLFAWRAGIEAIADDGIPVFASSGDNGAWSDYNDNAIDPLFPASDPAAIAVGGTTVEESETGGRLYEWAWSGGGGGVSGLFEIPSWQRPVKHIASTVQRNLPDVAMQADPNTGAAVAIAESGLSGSIFPVGGTSASSPTFAGIYLLAAEDRKHAGHKPIKHLASALYSLRGSPAFYDVTVGNNGYYIAGNGYDNATGLGAPDAWNLILALK